MEIVITGVLNTGNGTFRPEEDLAGRYYNDTGLCNRLMYWELLQFLNKKNNNKFKIVVSEEQWPEKNIINLPNTVFRYNNEIDISNHIPLSRNMVNDILNKNIQLEDGNYYADFKYQQLSDFLKFEELENKDRIISTVKFHDSDINNLLEKEVSDMVGIHLRRGRGVKCSTSALDTLPESIRGRYHIEKLKDENCWPYYIYNFIDDETYFNYIDTILKLNPNQKFFVSSDMEDIFIKHWFDRYPNNLFTKKNLYESIDVKKYLHDEKYSQSKPFLRKEGILHFYNFLDLYCLCNTKMLIKLSSSSWSDFASEYGRKKVTITAKDISPRAVLKLYRKNFIN